MAALVRAFPDRFSFFAVVPLPYTDVAIKEAEYALGHLGAIGVGVLSSHEGKYLGNSAITPFFHALNNRNANRVVIFMHPTSAVLDFNGSLISANPSEFPKGLILSECCFVTAQTYASQQITLTASSNTILKLPELSQI